MQQQLTPFWWPENSDLRDDFPSGAKIRQTTASPAISHDLYHEQPYTTPDGNRFAIFRTLDGDPTTPGDLLVYDIERYRLARLERNVRGIGAGIAAIATAAWSGHVFLIVVKEQGPVLTRINLETLEWEELFEWRDLPGSGLQTISPDCTWGLISGLTPNRAFGIYRLDLKSGACELIHENPFIPNPHLQIRLYDGERILVQENRGCVIDEGGQMIVPFDERGVGLYSLDANGNDRKDFPVGPPITAATTGHECWIGDTGRVLVTLHGMYDDGTRRGNVLEVSHDWEKPRVVFESPKIWNHIAASRCGRYFIADTYDEPDTPILIGHIDSGRTEILCPSFASGGGAQYTHAHPYLTADNRWAVFNSSRVGIAQVSIASVPEGFLEKLGG